MRGLKGKTVLLTGGANGIGAAIARRLGEEGCVVGILDLDGAGAEKVTAEIKANGGKASAHTVDISDYDAVKRAVEAYEAAVEVVPPTPPTRHRARVLAALAHALVISNQAAPARSRAPRPNAITPARPGRMSRRVARWRRSGRQPPDWAQPTTGSRWCSTGEASKGR